MAISFQPANLDFGNVETNTTKSLILTITNDSGTPEPLASASPPFSIDPVVGSIPACAPDGTPGGVTLTVKFAPSGDQPYLNSLSAGGVTCNLTGTGVFPDTEETVTTKKALLLKVPDYSDGVYEFRTEPGHIELEMQSFLRLGAFDYASEPPRAKQLLGFMHQAGPPGDPSREDKFGDAFDASNDFTDAPPFQPRITAQDAVAAGNRDVFFLDDVRIRDVDVAAATGTVVPENELTGHGLTMKQRQEESARLYSRGGWRDHSDGNRITTTYGDKVEVIRGNYKMVVMGRQDDPGEAMGWDVGGSHLTDYAPGTMPGACYWHQWVPDYKVSGEGGQTGVWLLVNTTENVYEYARNAGNFREEVWGDLMESYVGSESPPEGSSRAIGDEDGTGGHKPPERLPGINYDLPTGIAITRATPPWSTDNAGIVRSNPHIVEKTWARRIDSWTGSPSCPVPDIDEQTYAKNISGKTGSSGARVLKITDETWAVHVIENTNVSDNIASNTVAASITEATTAGAIVGATTASSIVETTLSTAIVGVTVAAVAVEVNVIGGQTALQVGTKLDMFFGGKVEIDMSGGFTLATALVNEVTLGEKKGISLEDTKTALEAKITALQTKVNGLDFKASNLKFEVSCIKADIGM